MAIRRAITTASQGKRFGYFAANYKILADVFRDMARITYGYGKANHSDYRIELTNGGVIECWSLESDEPGRSRKYHECTVDEAAHAPKLEQQWRDCIRPTLSDYAGGCTFYSTPKGRNFFYQLSLIVDDGWAYFHAPTSGNPYISAEEIESARTDPSMTEQSFAQEYLAEFLEDSGAVFRRVLDAVDKDSIQTAPEQGRSYALGVDLARYQDFTVLCVLDDTGRQVMHERFNQISWERQVQSIVEACQLYRPQICIDSTGVGDAVTEQLRKAINEINLNSSIHTQIPAIQGISLTLSTKGELIDNLALDIESGRLRLLDVQQQTSELLAYEYERTTAGNLRTNAPQGMHDDCVIALAMANQGRRKLGPVPVQEITPDIGSVEHFMRKSQVKRKYRK